MPGRHANILVFGRAKDDVAYHLLGSLELGINGFLGIGLSFI